MLALPSEVSSAKEVIADPADTSELNHDGLDYCLTDIERVADAGSPR